MALAHFSIRLHSAVGRTNKKSEVESNGSKIESYGNEIDSYGSKIDSYGSESDK